MEGKREREEAHLFLTATVITDETFSKHAGFDLASFDEHSPPLSDLPSFRVLKQERCGVFKGRIAQHFNYNENQIRLWVLCNRRNKTVRPDTYIPDSDSNLSSKSPPTEEARRLTDSCSGERSQKNDMRDLPTFVFRCHSKPYEGASPSRLCDFKRCILNRFAARTPSTIHYGFFEALRCLEADYTGCRQGLRLPVEQS